MSSFRDEVYRVVENIPRGQVMSYAGVAAAVGRPRAVRAVGNALHSNPKIGIVPCHRVVRSDRRIGGYIAGQRKKEEMLRREGVRFENGKVLPTYIYERKK